MTDRILEGALRALTRHGVRKFSMSDVIHESGVSRGTVYRYFSNKTEVLEAVGSYVGRSLVSDLEQSIEERPGLDERIIVVVETLVRHGNHSAVSQLFDVEPAFIMAYLRREFPNLIKVVRKSLKPLLANSLPVRSGALSENQLVEMLLRMVLSAYVIPTPDIARLPKRIADAWSCLLLESSGSLRA